MERLYKASHLNSGQITREQNHHKRPDKSRKNLGSYTASQAASSSQWMLKKTELETRLCKQHLWEWFMQGRWSERPSADPALHQKADK